MAADKRSVTHACRSPGRQGGFIITIELILITSILIIGSLVGLAAIRDALFKHYMTQQSRELVVEDANGRALGEVFDVDEHDAPRILYFDRSQPPVVSRALIGIRDDRFSSREPLYYATANCSGDPCIKSASDEATDSRDIAGDVNAGSVSYLHALQGGPVYAIGPGEPAALPGFLYRGTPQQCPFSGRDVQSRWISQKVIAGTPCETFTLEEQQNPPADTSCLLSTGVLDLCTPPPGTVAQDDILTNYLGPVDALVDATLGTVNALPTCSLLGVCVPEVEVGTLYCPVGTQLQEDGDLVTALVRSLFDQLRATTDLGLIEPLLQQVTNLLPGTLECSAEGGFQLVESVPSAENPSDNALEGLAAPFQLRSPGSTGNVWFRTSPDGEGR
ncbi:hypothetical protein Q4589_01850 [Cobetia marina]|uniref:hypothetical protein n=1 Tax=Cobetia marina TaxID=28258 RepID=UPI0026E26EA4|nr:hypothetical protein [Cobetia marina]MDO6786326.1 hypothetical protein [Cobetia marina]